jgi:hypothetical protein
MPQQNPEVKSPFIKPQNNIFSEIVDQVRPQSSFVNESGITPLISRDSKKEVFIEKNRKLE